MPLDKSIIPIDFGGGIDQSADPKQTIATKLARLDNGYLERAKRISKRAAFTDAIPTATRADTIIDFNGSPIGLQKSVTFTPDKINTLGNQYLTSGTPQSDGGYVNSECQISLSKYFGSGFSTQTDMAVIGTVACITYDNAIYQLIDLETGTELTHATPVSGTVANGAATKVVACNGRFVIVYNDATSTKVYSFDPSSGLVPGSPSNTLTGITNIFDVISCSVSGIEYVFVLQNTSTTNVRLTKLNANGTTNATFDVTISAATVRRACMCIPSSTDLAASPPKGRMLWISSVAGLSLKYVDLASMVAYPTLGASVISISGALTDASTATTGSSPASSLSAIGNHSGNGEDFALFYDTTSGQNDSRCSFIADSTTPSLIGATRSAYCGGYLSSKPFARHGRVFLTRRVSGPNQTSYILEQYTPAASVDLVSRLVGRFAFEAAPLASDITVANVQSTVSVYFDGTLRSAFPIKTAFGGLVTFGLQIAKFDFDPLGAHRSIAFSGKALVVGGFLGLYDGAGSIVDNCPPDVEVTGITVNGSGAMADGTYDVVALTEWSDSTGDVHRSAPGVPYKMVVSGHSGSGGIAAIATVTYGLTLIAANNLPPPRYRGVSYYSARTVYYRTLASGSVFYNTESVGLGASDADLADQALLYTEGGEFDNFSPDSPSAIACSANRVFINDINDDGVVYYSPIVQQGLAVNFKAELNIRVPVEGGPITAIAVLDDKILIFKRRAIYFTVGDGLSATGQGNNFAQPQLLPHDGGCRRQAACVNGADGVIVQSDKGIHLIGRDLSWNYIGSQVRDELSGNVAEYQNGSDSFTPVITEVTAMAIHAKRKEVWIASTSYTVAGNPEILTPAVQTLLAYNYEFLGHDNRGQWHTPLGSSVYDDIAGGAARANDIAVIGGRAYIASAGYVSIGPPSYLARETDSDFNDLTYVDVLPNAPADYGLQIVTGPINVSGIDGFQRVWWLHLTGELSLGIATDCEISVWFDYDNERTFADDAVSGVLVSTLLDGGGSPVFRLRVKPARGKHSSLRVKIVASPKSPSTHGADFSLTSMTLVCGVKKGAAKLSGARTK